MTNGNNACGPCDVIPPPQLIQLTIGDDWGLGFLYVDKANAPIMLGSDAIIGQLYAPFQTSPLVLDDASGRSQVVDQPDLSFVLGLERSATEILQPDGSPPVSHLQILRETVTASGLQRTIAHFSLQIMKGNVTPVLITQPISIDPLSGDKVVLVGYTDLVPAPPGA